jgi:predicted patatin/cPLA2 family phospholipase
MPCDLILLLDGGGLAGVFGAGVVTAFHRTGLLSRILSIYAVSSGAHNAAYLLSEQTDLGSTIYWEDLARGRFFRRDRILPFLSSLFLSRFRQGRITQPLLDFNHLEQVESGTKRLDVGRIAAQPISFRVLVFNLDTGKREFVDGKVDTVRVLRASSSIGSYCDGPVNLNGKRCIDGGTIRRVDVLGIINANPGKKFLYVMNRPHPMNQPFSSARQERWYAFALGWRYGKRVKMSQIEHYNEVVSPKTILSRPNVIGILNNQPASIIENDQGRLKRLYDSGLKNGNDIARQLMTKETA